MSARKVKERWTVDFWFEHASGKRERVRKAAPVNTRRGAEEFERQLRVEMLSPTVAEKVVRCESPPSWDHPPRGSPGSWDQAIARVMGPPRGLNRADRQGHGTRGLPGLQRPEA